jgi:hypothetical protein
MPRSDPPPRPERDVPSRRQCLCCRATFLSEGFGERICRHSQPLQTLQGVARAIAVCFPNLHAPLTAGRDGNSQSWVLIAMRPLWPGPADADQLVRSWCGHVCKCDAAGAIKLGGAKYSNGFRG